VSLLFSAVENGESEKVTELLAIFETVTAEVCSRAQSVLYHSLSLLFEWGVFSSFFYC